MLDFIFLSSVTSPYQWRNTRSMQDEKGKVEVT